MLLLKVFVVIISVVLMECFSWFIHKYLFHGPLWFLHKSHHQKTKSHFEWNDLFAIVFAVISLKLMYVGRNDFSYWFCMGLGIALYGLIYFIVHDWFVHRMMKTFKTNNGYLLKIRRAHKIHHKNPTKDHGKAFGLLFVNGKLFKTDKI